MPESTMNPELQYLLTCRDVIAEGGTNELVIIRPFDTVFIPVGQKSVVYSFYIAGRLFLNGTDLVSLAVQAVISDAEGKEIQTRSLSGTGLRSDIGINLTMLCPFVLFEKEGQHFVDISVSINNGEFQKLSSRVKFLVKQLT